MLCRNRHRAPLSPRPEQTSGPANCTSGPARHSFDAASSHASRGQLVAAVTQTEPRALAPRLAERRAPASTSTRLRSTAVASASRRRRSRRGRSLRPPCRRWAGHPYGDIPMAGIRRPRTAGLSPGAVRRDWATAYAKGRFPRHQPGPCIRREARSATGPQTTAFTVDRPSSGALPLRRGRP